MKENNSGMPIAAIFFHFLRPSRITFPFALIAYEISGTLTACLHFSPATRIFAFGVQSPDQEIAYRRKLSATGGKPKEIPAGRRDYARLSALPSAARQPAGGKIFRRFLFQSLPGP